MKVARTISQSIVDAVGDAIAAVPEWVPRGVVVLVLAGATWGGPLGAAVIILDAIGGLSR